MKECKAPKCCKIADYQGFCKKHYFLTDGEKPALNNGVIQKIKKWFVDWGEGFNKEGTWPH